LLEKTILLSSMPMWKMEIEVRETTYILNFVKMNWREIHLTFCHPSPSNLNTP